MPAEPRDVRLLVLDVDGVLTDGGLYYGPNDVELKRFNVKDGFAMRAAQRAGLRIGILTARTSAALTRRAAELEIEYVLQGSPDKARDVRRMAMAAGFELDQVAFMGDDLPDLPAMRRVGYPMTVADAAQEVHELAAFITEKPGGHGAVREAIEHLLKAKGRWCDTIASYTNT
jgi:3-deoxy-D-manno-octulosonate 8-phosphate phosphatase (KDO 8-P phosphatase)